MLSWFTGEFDNFQQVWQQKEDKLVDSLCHEHIHSIFLPVKMPAHGQTPERSESGSIADGFKSV
jgi:hypothetical protein